MLRATGLWISASALINGSSSGIYPVVLYGEDKVCANPIIDRQRHIASIDGACVLKDDGAAQLPYHLRDKRRRYFLYIL